MPITPKQMVPGTLLSATYATLYTVPSTVKQAIVSEIRFCNTDASARTFTTNVVVSGDTAGDKNTIHDAISLSAGDTYKDSTCLVLQAGDSIQAKSDAADKISIFVNGVEYT